MVPNLARLHWDRVERTDSRNYTTERLRWQKLHWDRVDYWNVA